MSIDLDEEWTNRVTQHALQCKNTEWKVIRCDKKRKFEMIEYYKCLGCNEILIKGASKPSTKANPSIPGPTTSDLNVVVPAALFRSATFPQEQAMELFTVFRKEAGRTLALSQVTAAMTRRRLRNNDEKKKTLKAKS
jgi:hypothetical protein